MSLISNVIYGGVNAQNEHRLKDIRREETAVDSNYNDSGGVTYEKTISASTVAGLGFLQDMERQLDGAKFFVGTVSYGQTYDNSSDTNFVVNPVFLEKLGTDAEAQKQFAEDVKFLNDFSKRFRAQQFAQGREIISQGWFCDENGNWGGWSVSRPTDSGSVLQDMADNAEEIRKKKLEERNNAEQELKEYFGDRFKGFRIEWLEENATSEEIENVEEVDETSEEGSESMSGRIGVNFGKTARKIAAAKTREQLRAVIAEIEGDMQEVKGGIEKGWCDQAELEKVKLLMSMAQNRMGQVEDREATPEEESMFLLASLI